MRVPINRGPVRPPPVKPPDFDPYILIAAAMMQEATPVPTASPAPSEPRSTALPAPSEPPPAEETAEVVDLGEARKARAEVDKHAELMSKLSAIDEVHEGMSKLARQFEAANDGSIQGAVKDGIDSVNTLVKDMRVSIANSVKAALAKQEQAFKDGIESSKGLLSQQASKIDSIRDNDLATLNQNLNGFNNRIEGLNQSLESLQSLLKAPKRILRDSKGRAIGSVVDPNLRGG